MNRAIFNSRAFRVLNSLEINIGVKGYDYIKEALNLITFERGSSGGVITLYEKIAADFDTTYTRVERAIRHFVETAYNQNSATFKKIFGNGSPKPTNSHFLKALSEYIKYESVGSFE